MIVFFKTSLLVAFISYLFNLYLISFVLFHSRNSLKEVNSSHAIKPTSIALHIVSTAVSVNSNFNGEDKSLDAQDDNLPFFMPKEEEDDVSNKENDCNSPQSSLGNGLSRIKLPFKREQSVSSYSDTMSAAPMTLSEKEYISDDEDLLSPSISPSQTTTSISPSQTTTSISPSQTTKTLLSSSRLSISNKRKFAAIASDESPPKESFDGGSSFLSDKKNKIDLTSESVKACVREINFDNVTETEPSPSNYTTNPSIASSEFPKSTISVTSEPMRNPEVKLLDENYMRAMKFMKQIKLPDPSDLNILLPKSPTHSEAMPNNDLEGSPKCMLLPETSPSAVEDHITEVELQDNLLSSVKPSCPTSSFSEDMNEKPEDYVSNRDPQSQSSFVLDENAPDSTSQTDSQCNESFFPISFESFHVDSKEEIEPCVDPGVKGSLSSEKISSSNVIAENLSEKTGEVQGTECSSLNSSKTQSDSLEKVSDTPVSTSHQEDTVVNETYFDSNQKKFSFDDEFDDEFDELPDLESDTGMDNFNIHSKSSFQNVNVNKSDATPNNSIVASEDNASASSCNEPISAFEEKKLNDKHSKKHKHSNKRNDDCKSTEDSLPESKNQKSVSSSSTKTPSADQSRRLSSDTCSHKFSSSKLEETPFTNESGERKGYTAQKLPCKSKDADGTNMDSTENRRMEDQSVFSKMKSSDETSSETVSKSSHEDHLSKSGNRRSSHSESDCSRSDKNILTKSATLLKKAAKRPSEEGKASDCDRRHTSNSSRSSGRGGEERDCGKSHEEGKFSSKSRKSSSKSSSLESSSKLHKSDKVEYSSEKSKHNYSKRSKQSLSELSSDSNSFKNRLLSTDASDGDSRCSTSSKDGVPYRKDSHHRKTSKDLPEKPKHSKDKSKVSTTSDSKRKSSSSKHKKVSSHDSKNRKETVKDSSDYTSKNSTPLLNDEPLQRISEKEAILKDIQDQKNKLKLSFEKINSKNHSNKLVEDSTSLTVKSSGCMSKELEGIDSTINVRRNSKSAIWYKDVELIDPDDENLKDLSFIKDKLREGYEMKNEVEKNMEFLAQILERCNKNIKTLEEATQSCKYRN